MLGNDISAAGTPRMWVIEDVVLSREAALPVDRPKKRWWKRNAPQVQQEEVVVVQAAAVSLLFRHMQRWQSSGLKMEVVHLGEDSAATEILDLLDTRSASPFTDVVCYPNLEAVVDALAFRPDVISVVDVDDRFMRYGGRGQALRELVA